MISQAHQGSHGIPGDVTAEDLNNPGKIYKMKKGDIYHVGKGSKIKWGSPSGGHCTSDLFSTNQTAHHYPCSILCDPAPMWCGSRSLLRPEVDVNHAPFRGTFSASYDSGSTILCLYQKMLNLNILRAT